MKRFININEIDEDGVEIVADSSSDTVLEDILRSGIGEIYKKGDRARVELRIVKSGDVFDIGGSAVLTIHPVCGRCLEEFTKEIKFPFHVVMAPLYDGKRGGKHREEGWEREIIKDDTEFSFFEGDSFDIAEIITEQIVLAQPMTYICSEDCKGLCPKCGKNLNKGPCGCSIDKHASPFDVLKNYKFSNRERSSKKQS